MSGLLQSFLARLITRGTLTIETASGTKFDVGDGSGPELALRFHSLSAEHRFLRDPELTFGELYMDGEMTVERGTLLDVLQLGLRNIASLEGSRWMRLLNNARQAFKRLQQDNTHTRARRNVAHHYDIDGRLYDLFLDADRQYSCAYFEDKAASLEEAQLAKKRHLAAKLLIEPDQRVLDIGCGWGGLSLYLATICNAKVTGVTLSQEQLALGQSRVRAQGLTHRIDLRLQDYRDVKEPFDRIVSVGMFEHVGVGFYDAYFRKIADLLSEDGVALIHTIGRPGKPDATNPWIDKYIFPGGYIPAMSEVLPAIERAGLMVTDIEVLQLHYAHTLRHWRERFMSHREKAAALYDERFCRMWEFYLAGSQACFELGQHVNFQFQLAKRVGAVPITRNYIAEREAQLRLHEERAISYPLAGE
jgi:cyclopropane-fatty-acyl-phospholipid synthase